MKNIFIIGASGLIGGALYQNLLNKDLSLVGTYSRNKEYNFLKYDILSDDYSIFKDINSEDTVVLMSAYSSPSWISNNKEKAKLLNSTKTKKLIDCLKPRNPKFIFMSSVEIFDGETGSYKESDQGNPLNYYGHLKLEIEQYLNDNYENFSIVRTGWNIGLNKKSRCVVQLTYETLMKPNAKMANNNYFSLASSDDTAEAISRLIKNDEIKILHACSDDVISRIELADIIISNSQNGHLMNYLTCEFSEIPYSEPRGRINDLNNTLSREALDMRYYNAYDLIIDKTKYIDKKYSEKIET